jgi:hypothetical protein
MPIAKTRTTQTRTDTPGSCPIGGGDVGLVQLRQGQVDVDPTQRILQPLHDPAITLSAVGSTK